MKKYLVLILIFAGTSIYIFNANLKEKEETALGTGDAPIHEIPELKIGGSVEEPNNDTLKIADLQTKYVMYTKGLITFDELIISNQRNLVDVLNFPFNPVKGYLFSVGLDDDSAVQFYYQSDQEETRTVIYKVSHSEDGNKVAVVYDGTYLKLVAINEENSKELLLYDSQNQEHVLEVVE